MKYRVCKMCGDKLKRGNLYCSSYCRANDPVVKYRVSTQMKGRKIWWGNKIAKALGGRKQTPEQIRKIHKNNPGMTGRKHNPGTIQKMRLCKLGNKNPMFDRKTKAITKRKQRLAAIKYIKSTRGYLRTNIGKNETMLLDEQEKKDGIKIIRQWDTKIGYIVDGYCPKTNIVYEVYEKHHARQVQRDLEREMEICKHLSCGFIIIKDM